MNKITIKTQAKFDALPNTFPELTKISITGEIKNISKEYKNAFIVISDKGIVHSVYGNGTVHSVYGNGTVHSVYGNGTVRYVYGNGTVQSVSGNGTVQSVSDNGTVQSVSDNGTVQSVSGNGTVQSVSGNGIVHSVYGNGMVQYVYEKGTVNYVSGNGTVQVYSKYAVIKRVLMKSVIFYVGVKGKPKKVAPTASVLYKDVTEYTKQDFLDMYADNVKGKSIILYKSVDPETDCDFYTGTIKYEGTVVCPDWIEDDSIECGNALHLSPTPELALWHNQGKLKECKVNIKDFVVYSGNIKKVRCKKVEVIGDYNNQNRKVK